MSKVLFYVMMISLIIATVGAVLQWIHFVIPLVTKRRLYGAIVKERDERSILVNGEYHDLHLDVWAFDKQNNYEVGDPIRLYVMNFNKMKMATHEQVVNSIFKWTISIILLACLLRAWQYWELLLLL